jgi:glycerol dehydrogenase-like iron-containing ADH family enzyme
VDNLSDTLIDSLVSACVISSPSAWAQIVDIYPTCPTPSTLIMNPSIQLEHVQKMASSIKEALVVGIGGGRIMDATKALAKRAKKSCLLIPSILSTTAWLNPTASLKKGSRVHHANGKYDSIIIDCRLIAAAPSHLNFGGLMDLLVGFSGLADWKLKKRKKGGYFPKLAEGVVEDYCDRIRNFMETTTEITPEVVPQMASYFVEGIANCYGLLSGRPLESGEHYLYYAIEELIDRPMNHGTLISLCMLICLRLHGSTSTSSYDTLSDLMKKCNIRYTLGDLNITPEQLIIVLNGMKTFVEVHKYPFSIWNITHQFDAFSVREFM